MFRTLGIIEAGLGQRPQGCKLSRRLGGKSILEWIVRRATECQQLDAVVVMNVHPTMEPWSEELIPPDVAIYSSGNRDRLSAYCAAIDQYACHTMVRIGSETPFVDPALIDRLVTTANENPTVDYVGYCTRDGRPVIHRPLGIFGECMRSDALRQANWEATSAMDRDSVTQYLCAHPERFSIRLLPAPLELDQDDLRLALDNEEDWHHTETIYEALGPEKLDWQGIARLLQHQPALRQRMASLNQFRDDPKTPLPS
jgi:spore coat polysaccharide biosynthesis protein SpsF